MNQDKVINKTLRDLKDFELIHPVDSGDIRPFFERVYVAGWEKGWEESMNSFGKNRERKVVRYNKQGNLIDEYDSILKAAKEVKYTDRKIYRALKSGKPTREGHVWKYKEGNDESLPSSLKINQLTSEKT